MPVAPARHHRALRGGVPLHHRLFAGLCTGLLAVVALLALTARPAAAHTKLVESDPANVSTVASPVDTVRLTFTKASQPARDKFAVTGPDGATITPTSIDNDGDTVIVAKFADPLPEGRNSVRWAIRASDTHVMTGTIAFTVTAPPTSAPATTGPATSAPSGTAASASGANSRAGSGDTATPSTTVPTANEAEGDDAAAPDDAESIDAQSLSGETSTGFESWLAALARWSLFAGLLMVVGGLIYLAAVHRGGAVETRKLVFWIRRAAVVVVLATFVDWIAQLMMLGGVLSTTAWGDVLTSWYALAALMRVGGAVLALRFTEMDFDTRTLRAGREPDQALESGSARRAAGGVAVLERPQTRTITRFVAASSPLAFVGAALLVASESFTGHTATTSPWPVVVASDALHLVAAAVWAAGAWMLAGTLLRRRRHGEPLDARLLAVHFSVAATWALVGVAVSGLVLAFSILDGFGALWSTGFGRLLVAKIVAVAVIAGIGAYNHRVLVPALGRRDTADAAIGRTFVRTVTAEAVLFVVVVGLTALLVAASPV